MTMIERAKKFYKTVKAVEEFETIKSLYITNFFNPFLTIKKGNLPFSVYRLDMLIADKNDKKYNEYALIKSYRLDNDDLIITINETLLIKAIRENYITELMRCCDYTKQKGDENEVKKDVKKDEVNEKHYKVKSIEPLDVIDEYNLDFYLGNVIKYVLRSKFKGSEKEDLLKAKKYIELFLDRKFKEKK